MPALKKNHRHDFRTGRIRFKTCRICGAQTYEKYPLIAKSRALSVAETLRSTGGKRFGVRTACVSCWVEQALDVLSPEEFAASSIVLMRLLVTSAKNKKALEGLGSSFQEDVDEVLSELARRRSEQGKITEQDG